MMIPLDLMDLPLDNAFDDDSSDDNSDIYNNKNFIILKNTDNIYNNTSS